MIFAVNLKCQMIGVFSKLIHFKGLDFLCRFFFCLISLESYNCISLLYLQHINNLPLLSSHSSSFGLFLSAASDPFGLLYLNQKWKLQWQGNIEQVIIICNDAFILLFNHLLPHSNDIHTRAKVNKEHMYTKKGKIFIFC